MRAHRLPRSQEYLKKNNIKNAVEKVVNAAVKQKALEPYSVMVSSRIFVPLSRVFAR